MSLPVSIFKQGLSLNRADFYNERVKYLRVPTAQYINHDFHDSFMHAKCSHQVRVLIENFVTHDIPAEDEKKHTDFYHSNYTFQNLNKT